MTKKEIRVAWGKPEPALRYAEQLLEQARKLATQEKKKPRQASLRRAVSTAYYSVFHRIAERGAVLMDVQHSRLRPIVRRAFEHSVIRKVAEQLKDGRLPAPWAKALDRPPSPHLVRLGDVFLELQQARHEADYDFGRNFLRTGVLALLAQAEDAHANLDEFGTQLTSGCSCWPRSYTDECGFRPTFS